MEQQELDTWRSDPTTVEIFNIMKAQIKEKEAALKDVWFNSQDADLSEDKMYLKNYTVILDNFTELNADDYNAVGQS